MGRQKKVSKPKEPVRIRQRKLKNGNISLYLDIYSDGVRKYESLSLYLVPEKDPISKDQNRHAMQVANKVKSERILGLQNRGIKQWEKIKQENMPLLTWLCKYEQSDGNFAKSTLKGRKEMRHKIEQYLATTGDINICLSEIDVDFCRGFVKFLKTAHHGVKKDATAVISQGCAHHHQAVFNGALNKAVREGIIASNPMKLLDAKEKHQPAESVREYLTIDELKAIMKADCANTEVKKAFIFSCFAGLRLGDVRALTWNTVFLASDGKTKFVRTIMEKTNKLVNGQIFSYAFGWLMLLISIQQFHWIACYNTLTHCLVQRSIEYRLMMMGATLTDYSCSVFLHSMMCRFQKLHEATAEIHIYF